MSKQNTQGTTGMKEKFGLFDAIVHLILILISISILYPLLHTVAVSFSDSYNVMANKVLVLPRGFNLESYAYLLQNQKVPRAFLNTVYYTVLGVSINLMMSLWRGEIDAVLPEKPDLILLPEVCDRYAGLSPERNRAYYDVRGNRMRDFFAGIARENRCCIAYSAVRQAEDGFFRNSTQLIGRTGQVEGIYNKNHLVVSEGPLDGPHPMLCGRDAVVSKLDFGRVGCVICFDLNFCELREKYMTKKPELLLFSSNYHGDFHQLGWAYGCRSYFACAVRNQEARVISPVGEVLAKSTCYYHYVTARINLDYEVCYLDFNWERFRAAREKYGAKIRIHDPGKTGAILLTSETDEFSAMDVVREFGIERMDDYFDRSRRDQHGRVEP